MSKESEAELQSKILHATIGTGTKLFRNQIGLAYTGSKIIRVSEHELRIIDPRPIKHGLVNGSSDLIGWTTVVVQRHHVGKHLAIFTGVEVKSAGGRVRENQLNFARVVEHDGGISGICRSVEEYELLIKSKTGS